ncbi:YlxR family protein [Fodinisporobacter ferrooxydans]|uniref:YlxR family protein n=1 Tax=Fodinisporobacter ferrooxydans TaxID=2901836 RepID=A0ABY4CIV6_9BACL|nr:YlxR family protein [Alicyclobacillaceae bacterium MYW30-H2]
MVQKRISLRKCVGCQEMKPKRSLIRVVHTPADTIELDPTGRKTGRGAYVCRTAQCFLAAKKKKALDRSLKVSVPDQVYDELSANVPPEEEENES